MILRNEPKKLSLFRTLGPTSTGLGSKGGRRGRAPSEAKKARVGGMRLTVEIAADYSIC